MSWRVAVSAGLFFVGCLTAVGCGGRSKSFAEVSGKVTIDGKPVTAGQIYFASVDDPEHTGSAVLTNTGAYSSKSIPVGKCKVSIKTNQYAPAKKETKGKIVVGVGKDDKTPKMPEWVKQHGGSMPVTGEYVATPEKYENPTTSGLEFEVKSGQNVYDVDLKAEKDTGKK